MWLDECKQKRGNLSGNRLSIRQICKTWIYTHRNEDTAKDNNDVTGDVRKSPRADHITCNKVGLASMRFVIRYELTRYGYYDRRNIIYPALQRREMQDVLKIEVEIVNDSGIAPPREHN